jgi:acetyl esterase/lipase
MRLISGGHVNNKKRDSPRASSLAGSEDVLTRPARGPDRVLRYGDGTDHVADLYLPPTDALRGTASGGNGPFILFFHGGFWRAQYDRAHARPLAQALAAAGFVVCSAEYRRPGAAIAPSSGWPSTFDDVAAAVDRLPALVAEAAGGLVGPARPVLAGHSAGGHLALWAASRHRLPDGSPWRAQAPPGRAAVGLAAVSELAECYRLGLGRQAAGALMGGGPDRLADRYAAADPAGLLPTGVRVRLVHGTADDTVPVEMSLDYVRRARAAGDDAECLALPGAGHFEVIDPLSGAWETVVGAFCAAAGEIA